MKTYGDLFTGFGGATCGAVAAGLTPVFGIELDPAIVEVANANLGNHVRVANLLKCNPFRFEAVDVLHASPPCPNFSAANSGGSETVLDIALGEKVAEFVTVLQPQCFTLENVWAYRTSRSWHAIEEALHKSGYWVSVDHCNAADYSVPQTRKRMIVRAIRGGFVPYLPEPVQWVGWYAATADLLDEMPDSQFAPWQLARLPELLASTLVGVGGYRDGLTMSPQSAPSMTITSNENMLTLRAFLVGDQERQLAMDCEPPMTVRAGGNGGAMPKAWLVASGNMSRELTIREDDLPANTITSSMEKTPLRSLFDNGRVVAMTTRALARFQTFPNWYALPDNARLAAKGIGNAVAPLLYQRIIESMLPEAP